MELKAVQFLISGLVQGVGYRAFAKEAADQLGLVGTVRNLRDGRVEAVVCGKDKDIALFRAELLKGPRHSRVDSVQSTEIKSAGQFTEFKILRGG